MTRRLVRLGHCYRCGYVWPLRRRVPRICARCKSPKFDVPKIVLPTFGGGLGIGEVIGPHRAKIERLARRYGATFTVFGSVARQAARPDSDVDLIVEWSRPRDILTHVELREKLQMILGRQVDLVTEDSLNWLVKPQALREMVPL